MQLSITREHPISDQNIQQGPLEKSIIFLIPDPEQYSELLLFGELVIYF